MENKLAEKILHAELRVDLDDYEANFKLVGNGKINESPETWEIDMEVDGEYATSYLYDFKDEYEADLAIVKEMKLLKNTPRQTN